MQGVQLALAVDLAECWLRQINMPAQASSYPMRTLDFEASAVWPFDAHEPRAASLISESGQRLGHIDARQAVPRIW